MEVPLLAGIGAGVCLAVDGGIKETEVLYQAWGISDPELIWGLINYRAMQTLD